MIQNGLREGALTLAYTFFVLLRSVQRRIVRPTTLGVRMVVTSGDSILLVRHRAGGTPWSLPGGGVDRQESLEEAAVREVREEGGCAVRVDRLMGVYYAYHQGMSNHVIVFSCTALEPARPPVGDIEIVDARFFAFDDLPNTVDDGSLRRIAEFRRGEYNLFRSW